MSYAKLVRKSWMRHEVRHDATFLREVLLLKSSYLPYEITTYIALNLNHISFIVSL